MVTIDISFKRLKSLLGEPFASTFCLSDLEAILFQIGFEIDDVLDDGDTLKIEITPDRLDAASLYGFARVIKAYLGLSTSTEYRAFETSEYKVIVDESLTHIRPFTVCAVVKGLNLHEIDLIEIIAVQEKLHATFGKQRKKCAIGIYPLTKISWPILYLAKPKDKIEFTPLGAESQMSAAQILSEHKTGKVYAHLLENHTSYPLFIDAQEQVLSMPPILNSAHCGKVTIADSDLFIECSGFDLFALHTVLKQIVCMLCDMGGTAYSVEVDYQSYELSKKSDLTKHISLFKSSLHSLDISQHIQKSDDLESYTLQLPILRNERRTLYTNAVYDLIGIRLNAHEVCHYLERMQYKATPLFEDTVELYVPPFRADIWHDVDVIDDVLRAYTLAKIMPVLPQLATTGDLLGINRFEAQLTDALAQLGFIEVKTLGVTDKLDQFEKLGISLDSVSPMVDYMPLGSTAESSINMLRVRLFPELLKLLMNNRSVSLPHTIFEIGHIILPDSTCDVQSKNVSHFSFIKSAENLTFTDAKQIVEYIFDLFGLERSYEPISVSYLTQGRSAQIVVKGVVVGYLGEISPQVLVSFGLEVPSVLCELDLSLVYTLLQK
jgi:phenylalanyl-tRNA synthetase beta chain